MPNRKKRLPEPPVPIVILCLMGATGFALNLVTLIPMTGRGYLPVWILIMVWLRILLYTIAIWGVWRMRRWGILFYTLLTILTIPYSIFLSHRITWSLVVTLIIPVLFINIGFRYYDKMR